MEGSFSLIATRSEPVSRFTSFEDGVESYVFEKSGQFLVVLQDLDSANFLPVFHGFGTLSPAIKYAKKCAYAPGSSNFLQTKPAVLGSDAPSESDYRDGKLGR